MCKAQTLLPYKVNNKWGYKTASPVIQPQYDTAFAFDQQDRIAMVGNKNNSKTLINPLTGEETAVIDYYFITDKNVKLKLKEAQSKDSISAFPNQEELKLDYLNTSSRFKVLYNNKVYLFNKAGKQLSYGFDNIVKSDIDRFYITELYTESSGDIVRSKGLIDTTGKTIIKCENKHITINTEDSVIYCCSAVFNRSISDEVYNYSGTVIYTNKNHIEFSSKHIHVYKLYEPKIIYMIADDIKKDEFGIEGEDFYYLDHNKALIVNKENWILVNLETGKKQKVNKELYLSTINTISN